MTPGAPSPQVGICVLDHHQPEATRTCIASLLAREPSTTRILWLVSEAETARPALEAVLAPAPFPWVWVDPDGEALPGPGTVSLLALPENRGYAGGNNAGLRFLRKQGVPYTWLLNNDTRLLEGDSRLLVSAAEARPDVGVWGTAITSEAHGTFCGHVLRDEDYRARPCTSRQELEQHPMAYISGCSLFLRTELAERLGYLPEAYFLYYEDSHFARTVRDQGMGLSAVEAVRIWHHEGLSMGHRSPLMLFYNARNRWIFLRRHAPRALGRQLLQHAYLMQKLFFRGRFGHLWIEYLGYLDYRLGRTGRTTRHFPRSKRV